MTKNWPETINFTMIMNGGLANLHCASPGVFHHVTLYFLEVEFAVTSSVEVCVAPADVGYL